MVHDSPPSGSSTPKLLTIPQVATLLQMGRDATYNLCHTGQLRCVKNGKRYLIPAFALDEYIAASLSAPVAPARQRAIPGKGRCPKSKCTQRSSRPIDATRQTTGQGGDR